MSTNEAASYYHVLVVGAVKTGKTSLLASLCHSQQSDYDPTVYAQRFVDTQRKIVWIDTPGVKDAVLLQGTGFAADQNHNKFNSFTDDTLVKELRGGYMDAAQYRMLQDPYICSKVTNNMNSIDAVLILYTDCRFSQKVAKALRFMYHRKTLEDDALKQNKQGQASASTSSALRIFTLRNGGDFHRRDVSPALLSGQEAEDLRREQAQSRSMAMPFQADIDAVFGEEPIVEAKQRYATCIALPDVNAMTETGVDEAMFRIHSNLGIVLPDDDEDDAGAGPTVAAATAAAKADREQCGGQGGCSIA